MDWTTPLLRTLHIVLGIYWLGTALFFVFFLGPVVARTGAQGQSVMGWLSGRTRFPLSMAVCGTLTLLSGGVMYWQASGHLDAAWLRSPAGLVLSLGAAAGAVAWLVSEAVQARSSVQIGRLSRALEAARRLPEAQELRTLTALQRRIARGAWISSSLLMLAVVCMVTWRYAA